MMSESVVLLCVLCMFCGVIMLYENVIIYFCLHKSILVKENSVSWLIVQLHKSILVKENSVSWLIVWLQEFVWVSMSKYYLGLYVKIYCWNF